MSQLSAAPTGKRKNGSGKIQLRKTAAIKTLFVFSYKKKLESLCIICLVFLGEGVLQYDSKAWLVLARI